MTFLLHSVRALLAAGLVGTRRVPAATKIDPQPSHRHPFFLPDGRQFLFYVQGTVETSGIHLGSLDSGETKRLTAADTRGVYLPSGWLLWVRAQALVAQRLVVNTPFTEQNGQFSPDGRWVAYETNESGRFEIVMQPFPDPSGKWQLSTGGGQQPRWRADGKELYFIAPDSKLMAVTVAASTSTFGKPVALFPTRVSATSDKTQYAVSRDGRFLMNQTIEESTATPITLIQYWNPEAKK